MNKEQKERFEAELLKSKETKGRIKNLVVDSASRFMERKNNMSENKNKLPPGYKIEKATQSNGCYTYRFVNPINAVLQEKYYTVDLEKLISYAWEDYEIHKEAIRLNALSELDYKYLVSYVFSEK